MFAGLALAEQGYRPIILERGSSMEKRTASVQKFWLTGELDTNCNVQFGEGGAGTFCEDLFRRTEIHETFKNISAKRVFYSCGELPSENVPAPPSPNCTLQLVSSSLDARKRNDIHFVHSVFVTLDSADLEKKLCEKNTSLTYVERSV